MWRTHHNRRWLFPNRRGDAPVNRRVLWRTFAEAAEPERAKGGLLAVF
jgi:hypothetical protein